MVSIITDVANTIRDAFGIKNNTPIIKRISRNNNKQHKNIYYTINFYTNNDQALSGAIKFLSLAISNAYDQKFNNNDITKDVRALVYNLITFGNVYIHNNKILPIYELSIVDSIDNIGKQSTKQVIANCEYVCINEMNKSIRKQYNYDDIYHLAMFPENHFFTDIYDRETVNVYGRSPTFSILTYLLWKEKLMNDDILIKDRMVPREIHKLNIKAPIQAFEGNTLQEKMLNYEMFINNQIDAYRKELSTLQAGEHYVVNGDVEIDTIESKVNYTTPNDLIHQINEYIVGAFNVPTSAVLSPSKSAYASELAVASYFTVQANAIIGIINEYLSIKYPKEDFTNINVVLDIWKDSLYKRVAVLYKTGIISRKQANEMLNIQIDENIDIINDIDNKTKIDGRTIAAVDKESSVKYDEGTPLSNDNRDEKDDYNILESNILKGD